VRLDTVIKSRGEAPRLSRGDAVSTLSAKDRTLRMVPLPVLVDNSFNDLPVASERPPVRPSELGAKARAGTTDHHLGEFS
jgi:hypothetical protein